MKRNKGLLLLFAVLLALLMFPVFGLETDGGACGEQLTWKLEGETLTISGTGETDDYSLDPAPWVKYSDVKHLILEEGTAGIGAQAFAALDLLETVSLPASLTAIGEKAFSPRAGIDEIRYSGTHTQWHALTLENEDAAPLILAKVECKTEEGDPIVLTTVDLPETESTCTVPGSFGGKQCSGCNAVLCEPKQKELKSHDWQIARNDGASCVAKGNVEYVCAVCGRQTELYDTLEPNTHLHTEERPAKEASCGVPGYTAGVYCSDCGSLLSGNEKLPALKHDWKLTVTPATLKRDGRRTYVCANCGLNVIKPVAQIASVALSETTIAKDGKKHTPTVTVRDVNGKKLKKGTAFTVSYDPGRKGFGTYRVTVTFQGNYAGKKTLKFTIGLAAPLKLKKSDVGATIASLSWARVKYATGYLLYYAPEKAGPFKRFAETEGCAYNISNLQPRTAYYFKVKAIRRAEGRIVTGPASGACGLRTKKQQTTSAGRVLVEITPENRYLAVVSHRREIPQSYQPKLKELSERGKYMDYEAAEAFEAMRAAARRDGVTFFAYSPYRSYSHQKASMESIIRDYQSRGYSRSRAEELALQVVLPPGTSEHNLGLSVDISSTAQSFKNTRAYTWLTKNGQKYGFILRYPDGRQDVTGITFEPWHWRYVGIDNAKKIKKSGLTLEEYTEQLKEPY